MGEGTMEGSTASMVLFCFYSQAPRDTGNTGVAYASSHAFRRKISGKARQPAFFSFFLKHHMVQENRGQLCKQPCHVREDVREGSAASIVFQAPGTTMCCWNTRACHANSSSLGGKKSVTWKGLLQQK
eukprot:scaffold98106_cov17-Tisochrysis_lutea.AAC.1